MADQIQTIWSEIDPRFVQDAQGTLRIAVNVDAAMASIDNILKTRKGERVMLPEFGSNLAGIIFEPINSTAIKFLSRSLRDDIERWDDRILVTSVNVYPDPDRSLVSITILFRIKGLGNILKYETEIRGEG